MAESPGAHASDGHVDIAELKKKSVGIQLSYTAKQRSLHLLLIATSFCALAACLSQIEPSLNAILDPLILLNTYLGLAIPHPQRTSINNLLTSTFSSAIGDIALSWPLQDNRAYLCVALLLQLFYLVSSLLATIIYLPLLEKIVHVYLIWPLAGFLLGTANMPVLSALLTPHSAYSLRHSPPIGYLSCLPVFISIVYHLVLRRHLVTIRLWQHLHSFPHLHVMRPSRRTSNTSPLSESGPVPAPAVHPIRILASRSRQLLYHLYTLIAPFCFERICVRLHLLPAYQPRVGPLLCVFGWIAVRLFISFHCFQVESVAWLRGAIGREGVVIWRERQNGLKVGRYIW